ncbi:bifunctional glutamate N-acetyltransferase/amino-acid acetyltransferase ArgJ [Rubrobacter tropicus]|uniref:Arginine biosynthesis bifunctional protein ArgJ n=1 Tax=Rubrobacter tropicus TaxID=2653851 RepID=A0A6G8QBX1_9ACTN|nr:bifunctional glutamate N-acetyltransferase/amino-acid acetyltransferase ArgJ [Rubrobacter tropicus]QIN84004.1 bifunctional glutamate N-acetyltransferase/amino-acid acetyltransferase ArgJ [Rubrobacter tropicus]
MNKDSTIGITTRPGGAAAPEGFVAGGVACGVRGAGVLDLGLLFSERPCAAAAVFTRNEFKGAPLAVTREAVAAGGLRAVVVNSGNANAATGKKGVEDAYEMQGTAAEALGVEAGRVAVASTGVIGEHLPMDNVRAGIEAAAGKLSRDGTAFAEAILTTDTRTKEAVVEVEVGGRAVTVGGTAKGSGMIHPNMGTMLAFLTTDAAVEPECLRETLARATDRTFNRVTVDGDTSPSDTALLLANGAAGNEPLKVESPDYPAFAGAVESVARELSKEIARDGEGATRLVEVVVEGAADEETAAALAKSVVGSSLVKAAVFGEDANWGRVLTAMGYAGVPFDPDGLELWFGPVKVFEGAPVPHEVAEANAALSSGEVRISARLDAGTASATAWGCDLSYEYVRINGTYRS